MKPFEEFINYWSELDLNQSPYIHPKDKNWLLEVRSRNKVNMDVPSDPEQWVEAGRGNELQFGLLPVPYCGDLECADIIICLLNPGLSPADFYAEKQQAFRNSLVANIRQDFGAKAPYPFLFLDPRWCWTAGYVWWTKKLQGTISKISNALNIDWLAANQLLAKRIAAVELFPYHSKTFSLGAAHLKSPSCIAAKKFVQSLINDPTRTVIVMRKTKEWELPVLADQGCDLFIYENGEQRGAHLSPDSKGGGAILKRILGDDPLV